MKMIVHLLTPKWLFPAQVFLVTKHSVIGTRSFYKGVYEDERHFCGKAAVLAHLDISHIKFHLSQE
jgi:hypothetical protein